MRLRTALCLLVAVVALLVTSCTPPSPLGDELGLQDVIPASGVGVCHWIAKDGLPDEVEWGTETTTCVHWRTIEPFQGVYDFGAIDEYVGERQGDGVQAWFAIQTGDTGLDGKPKVPQWLIDRGAVWHTGMCSKGGLFAPWDTVYLDHLAPMLQAVNAHIMAQDADYRATVGGIVIGSGGAYGEYQLHSCGMYDALRAYYGYETAWQFDDAYYSAVRNIVRIYADAFPGWPLMLQVGTPPNDHAILNWFVREYRERAYVKWAGLEPDNIGDGKDHNRRKANERYATLFRFYKRNGIPAHFGFEPGHPTTWAGPAQYLNAMAWAERAEVSYMCFQAGAPLWAAYSLAEWAAFDAQLEANAAIHITPTPTATAIVPTVMPSATPTPTITCTSTSTPTATLTPTVAPTVLPAVMQWICKCRQVTVTVTPPAVP